MAKILKNRSREEAPTAVTVSGRADQPEFSTWEAVGGVPKNAFIKATPRSSEE